MVLSYRVLKTTVWTCLVGSIGCATTGPLTKFCLWEMPTPPHFWEPFMEFHGTIKMPKGQKRHQGPWSDVADARKDRKFTADERALLAALGVPPLDQELNSACGRCPPHPTYFQERPKPPRVFWEPFVEFHGTMKMPKGQKDSKDPILMWLTLAGQ